MKISKIIKKQSLDSKLINMLKSIKKLRKFVMDKIHPRVSRKLDLWQQSWYSKWFYFVDEYDPVDDKSIEKYLLETVYDENWKQNNVDVWSKEEYEKFRDKLIRKVFPTVYFPELVNRLSEWNLYFSVKP